MDYHLDLDSEVLQPVVPPILEPMELNGKNEKIIREFRYKFKC